MLKSRMDKGLSSVKIFDKIAKKYTKRYFNDTTDIKRLDLFLNRIKKGDWILDVGCGPGNYSKYIKDKGYKVFGIDLSEKMINIARKKVKGVDFRIMDMRDMKFDSDTFSGICALYSILFVPRKDANKMFKEFSRVLTKNGILMIVVHKGKPDHYIEHAYKKGERLFVNLYTNKQLKKYLMENGFEIITIKDIDSPDESRYVGRKMIYCLARNK